MTTVPGPDSAPTSNPRPHATMKQVAALAEVGIKTVSRVINDEPNVTEATARRVWEAIRTLDYHVDEGAGNLRRGSGTRAVGLLVGSVDNPFAGTIHRAVEDVARQHAMAVFASSLNDDPETEHRAVSAFLRRRVDGLILTTVTPDHTYLLPAIERGTPAVFIDRAPAGIEADAVVSDNSAGIALATRHLLAHGHRRIAFLGDRLSIRTAVERKEGFLSELSRAGVPLEESTVVNGLHDEASAARALAALLDSARPPTAVLSAQNLITYGALAALHAHDARQRTALVGFDDFPLAHLLAPAITVIAQNPADIGRLAAERLFRRIAGERLETETIVVPTHLIARGSGEIPPSPA